MQSRPNLPALVIVAMCCSTVPISGSTAHAQAPSAPRAAAFVSRGDLVSAELPSVDVDRQIATLVTVNAYTGLALPGEPANPAPRRMVVVIDRRHRATGAPILFAVGTVDSFQLEPAANGVATLHATVPMYALDGQPLFQVVVDLAFTAAAPPRAVHWINPFNVPGFASVFHALEGATEAAVTGRVALGDANFSPQAGRGVVAIGARVIVGVVPRDRSERAATAEAAAPAEAPAAPSTAPQPPAREPSSAQAQAPAAPTAPERMPLPWSAAQPPAPYPAPPPQAPPYPTYGMPPQAHPYGPPPAVTPYAPFAPTPAGAPYVPYAPPQAR